MGLAAHIQQKKARVYCLQYDENTPQSAYFFLKVDALKEPVFLRAVQQKQDVKLEHFGTVIASGWGSPSASLRQQMADSYSLDFAA